MAEWRPHILVCDDEEIQRNILREILVSAGHEVATASGIEEALTKFRAALASDQPFHLVLTDLKMPGDTEGLTLLGELKALTPEIEVVLMTAYSAVRTAVQAMKQGAFEYLPKPFDKERLLHVVQQATAKLRLVEENRRLRALVEEGGRYQMVGRSPRMQELFRIIERVARTDTTCLIRGESGTGKELVARAIHRNGPRTEHPFLAINCAAIPETLIESELFGHEKGVFTGASTAKLGRFEEVGEGTLLLDEIGSMKYDLQAKLLRVIQEREFSRVGSARLIPFNGRIVAATAQDLEALIRRNEFREDLYFRLNVVPIEIPPLRARKDDIPMLVERFIHKLNARLGTDVRGVQPEVLEAFEAYSWPGNVRELENCIERLMVLGDAEFIEARHLPPALRNAARAAVAGAGPHTAAGNGAYGVSPGDSTAGGLEVDHASAAGDHASAPGDDGDESHGDRSRGFGYGPGAAAVAPSGFPLPRSGVVLEDLEADLIRQALQRTGGRLEPAAQLLGITYKTLQYRIKKYDLRETQDEGRKRAD